VPHFNVHASSRDAANESYVIGGNEKTASNQLNAMMHRFVAIGQLKTGRVAAARRARGQSW